MSVDKDLFGSDVNKVTHCGMKWFFWLDLGILLSTYKEEAPRLGTVESGMMISQF